MWKYYYPDEETREDAREYDEIEEDYYADSIAEYAANKRCDDGHHGDEVAVAVIAPDGTESIWDV